MALDQKFFKKSTAAGSGLTDQEQGLIVHLDANDVDSYDGDGSVWYDITDHAVNIPLADKSSNLILNLDGGIYTSDTWADQTTNGNNASLNGNATYNSDTRGYFTLDGTGDYLQIADHSSLNLGAATYEMWFRQPSYIATEHLFGRYESSNYDFFIRTSGTSGAIETTFYNGSSAIHSNIISGNNAYTANEWSHVAVTLAGNTTGSAVKLYVNGTLQATQNLTGNRITDAAANLYLGILGSGYTTQYEFTGDIGTTRIYNVALTASEVGQNYRAGNFLNYSSIITSKPEATQGSLITAPPTQGTLYTSNLAFHLDANGHSGTYWTDSVGSINGTINGATYVNNDNSDYFTFDGSDDTVTFPATDTSPINFSSETHTIEFWVNFNNLSNDDVIIGKFGGSNATKSFQIQVSGSHNKLTVLERDGGSNNTYETTGTFSNGTWSHFVYARSASQVKLYINGVIDSDPAADNGINAGSTQNITIGDQPGGGVFFDGKLAQLRIYSSTLDSSQVLTNYNATKDLYQGVTSLKLHLDANEYSGSGDWQDSANNNDGVINGATYTNDNNSDYFDFDGNDKITVAGSDLNPANTRAIELWFNADITSGASSRYMISNWSGTGNNYGYHIYIYNNTLMAFMLDQSQSAYFINFQSGGTVTAGKWHHAVLTIGPNASDNKLYLDGELKQTASSTSGTFPTTVAHNGIIIGAYGSSGYYDGKIAQVRAYKGTLTQAQINTNYNATKALYQNPTLKLHFDASDINTTANTWTDKVSSLVLTKSGTSSYDAELGDYLDFGGGYYANDSYTDNFEDSSGNTTVEFWYNADAFSGLNAILQFRNGASASRWHIGYSGTTFLSYYYGSGGTNASEVSTTTLGISANKWYYFSIVKTPTSIKYYIDGVLKETDASSVGTGAQSLTGFRIGDVAHLSSYGSDGKLGDLKIYQGEMSVAQITQNYLATKNNYPNGNNATLINTPTWGTYNSGGVTYNYFDLNGSNHYMTIPHNTIFDFAEPTTMELWVSRDSTNRDFIIDKSQGNGWQFEYNGSSYVFQLETSGGLLDIRTSVSGTGSWEHVVITFNASSPEGKLYLNGVFKDSGTAGSASTNTNSITIGKYSLASGYDFDGKIGMIKFYNKTFSATEVTAAYNNTKGTYGIT